MSKKNWDEIIREEREALDPSEREWIEDLRVRVYGE